jgi:hypothetical protein
MCAGSPPPAPDYKGAAEATGRSQQVSQYTPYGSQVYSADPTSPSGYKSTISLAPGAQGALDTQIGLSKEMGNLAQEQIPGVREQYSQPMDQSSVQDIANKSYEAQTSRLDPQWNQREDQTRTRLANQGLMSGGEAYGNEMRDFNAARNDAYQQANLASIATMPQTYQLASSAYNQPLNTLNALRTGAQIQNPQFGPGGQPVDYSGAAKAGGQYATGLYNADVQDSNNQRQNAAMIAALATYMSDRRLKRNIRRIGTKFGLPWYRFTYIWGQDAEGVMADEVLQVQPEAVTTYNGYLAVNYAML